MKTNVTFNQIATELVNIFSNEARTTEYNAQRGPMRQGVCGWCGIMSPVNRLAFVEDFGVQTVTLAEVEARRRMADKAKEYAATHHAAHVAEANQNEQRNAAPVAGSFVWAVETGMKNEGQGVAGVIADAVEGYDVRRRLVCVERVINATAADFLRPSLADELVKADTEKGEEFPGGSRNDDDNFTDFFDNYKTWYTVAAAVVDPSGRWFLIDAEGYSYARYILMPTNWGEQFATEKAAAEQKKADREEQERREAEQQAADRLAEYVERCNKWAHLMTDLRPLVAAEKAAADKYGYRSNEAKTAARKLQAARRGNVSAMVRAAFPGLRLSMTVNNGWGSAYDLTYYDGPTRDRFENGTDLNLFEAIAYTFDGMTDCADFDRHEFTEFSEKFFACKYGGVKVDRKQSDENAAAMLAAIVETVPAAADNEPREWTADELQAVAARLGCDAHELSHRLANYRQTLTASDVARIAFHICDFSAQKPQEPTTPTDPTNGKANTTEAATSDENAPADGLELVEIADGVAVVGDSRTTYRNRKAIKAHGARWNRDAQQWQATTPEAVEQLRQWFGVAQDEQPEPTTEANDTTTAATEAAQAPETATTDQQPTESENGAQSAQDEPEEFRTVEFYNREGVTDEQGRRVKTHDQITQQAARIECNYIAGRDGLRGIARRLERTKGANHPDTLAAYKRLQSRAAWLRRAELAAHAAAGRKRRAAYLGTAEYYANKLNGTKSKAVSFRFGSRFLVLVKNRGFWDMSNANGTGTQYEMTAEEAADVLALTYQDAQREAANMEAVTRDSYGIDHTADGLEFRAVVVENETGEEIGAFLNIEDAHAFGWYGYRLDADEDAHDNEGSRGARLLFQCCREEDAGTDRISYGNCYEQAAANYRAEVFGATSIK